MSRPAAYITEAVFDGSKLHSGAAAVVTDGKIASVANANELPADCDRIDLGPGILAPGFVDLQVNGGGGAMVNDDPSVETLATIAEAHGRLGSTSILPTLITDTREQTSRAISAAEEAVRTGVPGIIGLHLEGPHLSAARKGAHDASLVRRMDEDDLSVLCEAARRLPSLMVTVAPESATLDQIRALAAAGTLVSLGHSDANYSAAAAAADAGATCVTHLFNAMSQLGHREPGMAGAALTIPELHAGLIADGIHVHPAMVAMALRAKQGPGEIFLVSDAMAPAGTEIAKFSLNGRQVERRDGRLTLADGTLAGADLEIAAALRTVRAAGATLDRALRMATGAPANVLGRQDIGVLKESNEADFVHLGPELDLRGVWRSGRQLRTDTSAAP